MSKLFNLKEWLTVADAAKHLSIVFGEDVNEADVLRLALDGRLLISVYFVNHAKARCCKVITWDETDWWLCPGLLPLMEGVKKMAGREITSEYYRYPQKLEALLNEIPEAERGNYHPFMRELNIDGERFLKLSDEVTTLHGVWDLPMIGNEKLDVEHEYQKLTGGPSVTLQGLIGTFVEGRDGQICQLQEEFDLNKYKAHSSSGLEKVKEQINDLGIKGDQAELLLSRYEEQRIDFLRIRRGLPEEYNCYPAGGLPQDAVIVVRTEALREFEKHSSDPPLQTSHTNFSDKLAKMNRASMKFWSNADRDDRGTHPDNATVAAWLVSHGFSPTLANKAATIIRPEWAPVGRKPEE